LIAASENVVVAENVIRRTVGDERAQSAATAKVPAAVVDVTSGHAETLIADSVIRTIIGKTRRERAGSYNSENSKDN